MSQLGSFMRQQQLKENDEKTADGTCHGLNVAIVTVNELTR